MCKLDRTGSKESKVNMSYVEHGPRIFLASKHNSGVPLIYGDYVLPKKRVEGRLKLHESCSDIRAWSPNCLENSRYFRELSEHDSPIGKIVPFNVVIDNIIHLNSQTQNELQAVKKELQKYKSLKLTPKQEEHLKNLDHTSKVKDLVQKTNYATTFLKDAFLNVSKSGSVIQSSSCLSIHIPCERHLQNNMRNVPTIRNRSNQLYSYSLTAFDLDPCLNNYNLIPSCKFDVKPLSIADYSEKASSGIEYIDIAVQIETEMRDTEVQTDDQVTFDKYLNKIITISATSRTSFTSKSNDEDNSAIDLDKSSSQTNNHEDQSFECDASCSDNLQDIGSVSESDTELGVESDFDLCTGVHKGIIIQKDSEIIVLKNEIGIRDAELEELRNMNKHLEILLKEKDDCIHIQQEKFKMLHEKLFKLDHQRNCKVEDLKQQLYRYKYLMEQLKTDLNEKCESCYILSQEIDKLKSYVKEVTTLRLEKDSLLERLQGTEQLVEKAEKYNITLERLRNVLQEKDELKKQNYEQNCTIEDQEEKLNQLTKVIKELSVAYNEKMEAKNILEDLRTEIHDKNVKISEYEEQLTSTKREISDFFNSLKYALNSLEELNGVCEDVCSCTKCDLDIGEEANSILYNINIIMTRFQSYKVGSQNLLKQVGNLKHYIENDKQQSYLSQNLKNIICEDFYCNSLESKNTNEKDSIIMLNVRDNKNSSSETEFEDNYNSANSENLLNEEHHKLTRMDNMDEIEKEIIEYFAHFLIKLRSLTQKLQVYVEIERPLMIKQIYYFYEILRDTQSAINITQDVTLKKQLISDLYNQHKEEHKKYNCYIKELPNDLLQMQNKINEFIEDILYQLLKEISHVEKTRLYDEKINGAFEMHLKSCIDRINTAIQGAGDQRIQIVETLEKQQKELRKKDIEIAQLKEEVAKQLEQKAEDDCLSEDKMENNAATKEHLSKITAELNGKDVLILDLEKKLQIFKDELFVCDKDCSALKKENKNIENIKNRLLKDCQQNKRQLITKNKQIKNLSHQIHELLETKNLKDTLENKIKEMEKELIDLQFKNNELERNIKQTDAIISTKEQTITSLNNNIDKTRNILSRKVAEYENTIEEKHREIIKLENENKLLCDKVKDIEHKLIGMNETIMSLTEQNDKINVIYTMQEDLTKLDKNAKKLRVELNNLKTQHTNDQNVNKELDINLDTFIRENEILKKNVEYWKNENSELSITLCNKMTEEKLKNKLYILSSKICERLLNLRKKSDLETDLPSNEFTQKLQDEYIIYQSKEVEVTTYNVKKDLKSENEIEEVQTQLLSNVNTKEETLNSNYMLFKRFNSPEDNNLNTMYNMKHLENRHNESKNEIEMLLNDIENKDCEIRHHKEVIKHLTQENADLRIVLKSQIEEYQDKLTLMKKNYDSSLHALCERHNANIEILQKQFEDNMKCERIFDSEDWLLSLNIKELMKLHGQISMIINSSSDATYMKNENHSLYNNNIQQQHYTKINETEKKFQILSTNVFENESTQNKMASSILKEENLHLHNQWRFIALGDTQKYSTLETQNYKSSLEHSFRYYNVEAKSPELENKYEKEKEMEKDSTFDQQRWNFINQCSAFHKLSNIYEYTGTVSMD